MKVLRGMVSELCPYFHTASGERYLCSVKEGRWGGREIPQLSVLECDASDFKTCINHIWGKENGK